MTTGLVNPFWNSKPELFSDIPGRQYQKTTLASNPKFLILPASGSRQYQKTTLASNPKFLILPASGSRQYQKTTLASNPKRD